MKKFLFAGLISSFLSCATAFSQDEPSSKGDGKKPGFGDRRPGFGPNAEGRRGADKKGGGEDRPSMMPAGMMMAQMMKNLPMMTALDADGNGELSASEIENASKSLLKLDKNGDGVISTEELRPDPSALSSLMPGQGGGGDGPFNGAMMGRMFEASDKNKDGKLSGDEIPERMRELVSRMDQDGDGSISREEMRRAAEMREQRGDRPQKGNNEGGGAVKPKRPDNK